MSDLMRTDLCDKTQLIRIDFFTKFNKYDSTFIKYLCMAKKLLAPLNQTILLIFLMITDNRNVPVLASEINAKINWNN